MTKTSPFRVPSEQLELSRLSPDHLELVKYAKKEYLLICKNLRNIAGDLDSQTQQINDLLVELEPVEDELKGGTSTIERQKRNQPRKVLEKVFDALHQMMYDVEEAAQKITDSPRDWDGSEMEDAAKLLDQIINNKYEEDDSET